MILTGQEAMDFARENSVALNKYTDPIEDALWGITIEEAEDIYREDPDLIWVDTEDI